MAWFLDSRHATLLEAADGLPGVASRKMFGCQALFRGSQIFALVWRDGRLGLRLPDAARAHPGGPTLRLPTSGLLPLADAPAMLVLLPLLHQLGAPLPERLVAWTTPGSAGYHVSHVLAALVVSGLASWLFARPSPVAGLVPELRATASDPPALARLWRRATLGSLAWVVAMVLLAGLLSEHGRLGVDLVGAIVFAAVALDGLAEWRARQQHGSLIAITELHDAQQVDATVAALAAAGVPAHARSAHHRTLLYFFGPFVPVVIAVPQAHVERARATLAR